MSVAVKKKSAAEQTARELAEFIVGKYALFTTARVLFWRETVAEYYASRRWKSPEWVRDCSQVHEHWKRYGKLVRRLLEDEHGLVVVCISSKARAFLKQGDSPARDDDRRTDSFYRQCLPSSSSPTFGFVCFPRQSLVDHPLVVSRTGNQINRGATAFANALGAAETAEIRGVITTETRAALGGGAIPKVVQAIASSPKPTLPQETPAIEGPVVAEIVSE